MNKNMIRSAAVRKVMLFYFKFPVGDDRAWVVVEAGLGRVVPDVYGPGR